MNENLSFDRLPALVEKLSARIEHLIELQTKQSANIASNSLEQPLSVKQAAEFLNIAVPTVYGKVSASELPHMKRGKRLYFLKSHLIKYLEGGKRKTKCEIADEALGAIHIKR